jgi:hypothetical protein
VSITSLSLEKGKVGMKLVEFQQVSWQMGFSSSGSRSQFLGNRPRKSILCSREDLPKKHLFLSRRKPQWREGVIP